MYRSHSPTGRARRGLALAAAAGALVALAGACATNRQPNLPAPLYGMVYGGRNQPVLGARVTVEGRTGETTTDINGRFALEKLPAGMYVVTVTAQLHEPFTLTVDFVDPKQVIYVKLVSLDDLLDNAAAALRLRHLEDARGSLDRARAIDAASVTLLYLSATEAYLRSDAAQAQALIDQIRAPGIPYRAVELLAADVAQHLLGNPAAAATALRRALQMRWDPDLEARLKMLEAGPQERPNGAPGAAEPAAPDATVSPAPPTEPTEPESTSEPSAQPVEPKAEGQPAPAAPATPG